MPLWVAIQLTSSSAGNAACWSICLPEGVWGCSFVEAGERDIKCVASGQMQWPTVHLHLLATLPACLSVKLRVSCKTNWGRTFVEVGERDIGGLASAQMQWEEC
jgi:hypothetical protein